MTGCAPECDAPSSFGCARTVTLQEGEISSSYAGINRIKFIGFDGKSTVFCRQTASISVHQHTPEQGGV